MTPDYIVNNWTEELLNLMVEKLAERKRQERDAIKGRGDSTHLVSAEILAAKSRGLIKVVKKDGD